jgi:hypothetical protein
MASAFRHHSLSQDAVFHQPMMWHIAHTRSIYYINNQSFAEIMHSLDEINERGFQMHEVTQNVPKDLVEFMPTPF